MGTTADKLNNIIAAKNALRNKFNLADDLPLSDYAANITGGGGGETFFYKCAEVGTETWTGRKAVLTEDTETGKTYYDFETELTTDTLTYGYGFTPEVGRVYDAEAMIKATLFMKTVLPATIYENMLTTTDGFTLSGDSVTATTVENRQCLALNYSSIGGSIENFPLANNPFTFALGINNITSYGDSANLFTIGSTPYSPTVFALRFLTEDGKLTVTNWSESFTSSQSLLNTTAWKRIVVTNDGAGTVKLYIDGQLDTTQSMTFDIGDITFKIGGAFWGDDGIVGNVANCKVWTSALTAEQVALDYAEFSDSVNGSNGSDDSNVPTDGLVFYAPLAESSDTAETGQAVIASSGISYTTIDGKTCIHFDSSTASIQFQFDELIDVGNTMSQSIWFYDTQGGYSAACISDYGNNADYTHYNHYNRYDQFSVGIQGNEVNTGTIEQNTWYHFCSVVDKGALKIYINGEMIYEGSLDFDLQLKYAKFGDGIRSTNEGLIGYASAARLYNRALTEDEIQQLYQEFSA